MSNALKSGSAIKVANLSSAPSNPENGFLYYNTSTNQFQLYKNGSFVTPTDGNALAASTGAASVGFDPTGTSHTGGATDVQTAMVSLDAAIATSSGVLFNKEIFTLTNTDITNQYVDLAFVAFANSLNVSVNGQHLADEGADYTVSLTGGVGGNTRVSFTGGLAFPSGASALVTSDVLRIQYAYS